MALKEGRGKFMKYGKGIFVSGISAVLAFSLCFTAFGEVSTEKNNEMYMRYITKEDTELFSLPDEEIQFDADKFFTALNSQNDYEVYIAINRLIECYNDNELKTKAYNAIEPFKNDSREKIANSAEFACDILSDEFKSQYVYTMNDGSIFFNTFCNYSDYGGYNKIWQIKDGKLKEYMTLSGPMTYISDFYLSPDKALLAVKACSGKSEFLFVISPSESKIGSEIVSSAKNKIAFENGYSTDVRIDGENYSSANEIKWVKNEMLEFKGSFTYNDVGKTVNYKVQYDFSNRNINVIKA